MNPCITFSMSIHTKFSVRISYHSHLVALIDVFDEDGSKFESLVKRRKIEEDSIIVKIEGNEMYDEENDEDEVEGKGRGKGKGKGKEKEEKEIIWTSPRESSDDEPQEDLDF